MKATVCAVLSRPAQHKPLLICAFSPYLSSSLYRRIFFFLLPKLFCSVLAYRCRVAQADTVQLKLADGSNGVTTFCETALPVAFVFPAGVATCDAAAEHAAAWRETDAMFTILCDRDGAWRQTRRA